MTKGGFEEETCPILVSKKEERRRRWVQGGHTRSHSTASFLIEFEPIVKFVPIIEFEPIAEEMKN